MEKIIGFLIILVTSLLLLHPTRFSQAPQTTFENWKAEYQMKFSEEQNMYRYEVFLKNL
jgi:hypothetical protein